MPLQQPGSRPGSLDSKARSQSGSRAASGASADRSSSPQPADAPGSARLPAPEGGKLPSTVPAAGRPGAPSREAIVGALRKLIEGLDTEDSYELCLDKVQKPPHFQQLQSLTLIDSAKLPLVHSVFLTSRQVPGQIYSLLGRSRCCQGHALPRASPTVLMHSHDQSNALYNGVEIICRSTKELQFERRSQIT